ncbi:conserved hypothetical protein [Xanthomonas oryzae pv. oryzae KACC 10331]|uniref:Uncharacterized protein n=1 Tax=Xanthomonas oryzae pv. oryzae (strain KACC10331 / KXO85) TaxID=291331 RepID=Q5H558_XANOR|nr:conserved hypothetical protein [Xanthomonas oryzae pv. oryzae KACC 10331]
MPGQRFWSLLLPDLRRTVRAPPRRDTASAPACARKTLDSVALTPGQVREFHGVSGQAHTCVDTAAPRADCHG